MGLPTSLSTCVTRDIAWWSAKRERLRNMTTLQNVTRLGGGLLALAGVLSFVLAPLLSDSLFSQLWAVEPLVYMGGVMVVIGLSGVSLSYVLPHILANKGTSAGVGVRTAQQWSQTTEQYFELFQHDLGRPMRRIVGRQHELRAILESSGAATDPSVKGLLDEIENQAPSFRLMMANIQVLVQLEGAAQPERPQPVEPTEVVRKILDRYTQAAGEESKEISWWAEPAEFGIVYSHGAAIEHIVTNLVDNAVRYAASQVEIRISRNPGNLLVRTWDDGPGILEQYLPHIFDHGWTPEVARREEKTSSGLGLFIARTLARRYGGDLTVESMPAPQTDHHCAFLVSLPLGTAQ